MHAHNARQRKLSTFAFSTQKQRQHFKMATKIHSLVIGAVLLGALTTMSFSQTNHGTTPMQMRRLGPAEQNTVTHFDVYLPLTNRDALDQLLRDQTDQTSPKYHQWLTPAQFKAQFGPSRSDMAKLSATLEAGGFRVVGEKTQSLEIEGPVSAVEKMFSAHLQRMQMEDGHIKLAAAERHLTLPSELAAMGAVIPEFTTHAVHVHSSIAARALADATPLFRVSSQGLFYPNDLNEAYQLPSFQTVVRHRQIEGHGAHIGIVISSVINPPDLAATFNSTIDLGGGLQLIQDYSGNTKVPVPKVTIRPVAGGSGPFVPDGAGFEASVDTQMSLGTAPGAQETLYNIPDLSFESVMAGYTAVDEDNAVDVVSSSFGQCELNFTAAYNGGVDFTGLLRAAHALFQQGNAQGITFMAGSGDSGALDCLSAAFVNNPTNGTNFVPGVDWPAADPNVTGVGGTNLSTTATPGVDDATYETENADFDPELPAQFQIGPSTTVTVGDNTWGSGGGFSHIFGKPFYQFLVNTGSFRHRSVPDVSLMMGGCPADADLAVQDCTKLPRSAGIIWVDGVPVLLIGTSLSSPEFAGVMALAVELNGGRLGNVNPLIYFLSALQTLAGGTKAPPELQFFHREISGNNNFFKVHPGQAYSEVLGNSTLDVKNFLGLHFVKPAGAPNTPSNP
jgi:subtilase family serine protease